MPGVRHECIPPLRRGTLDRVGERGPRPCILLEIAGLGHASDQVADHHGTPRAAQRLRRQSATRIP